MAPYDEVFIRLETGDETRKIARSLCIQATQLTTHGSGRALAQGRAALPAICAFLASQRLGNGEVTKAQACAVACVDPKTFDATLSNVESILRTACSPQRNQKAITFRALSKTYVAREDAYVPMMEVEEALKACGELVDGTPIAPNSPLTQCAIFYWVCTTILRVTIPDATHFREMLKVAPKKWVASQRVLEKHCSHMVDDLVRKAKAALSSRTTRSQIRTSTQETMQAGLSNSSACPNGLSVPLISPKMPFSIHNMKRKRPVELESKEICSPSKRIKASSYVPSKLGQDLSAHTPIARRRNAASVSTTSQPAALLGEDSDDDEAPSGTIIVPSTRLHQKVDHGAWNSQRPRMTSVGPEPVTPSFTQRNPSTCAVEFNDTPLTSTGMSDASSPSSPLLSRTETRLGHFIPPVEKLAYSVQENEEISRRRRRNLRAAFLDPSMYSWRPDAQTAKKLERARIWESRMIEKYGDPWDA